jgi:hypothetical protein
MIETLHWTMHDEKSFNLSGRGNLGGGNLGGGNLGGSNLGGSASILSDMLMTEVAGDESACTNLTLLYLEAHTTDPSIASLPMSSYARRPKR